eukprot:5909255-Pyramimonas_sp.AAC.1
MMRASPNTPLSRKATSVAAVTSSTNRAVPSGKRWKSFEPIAWALRTRPGTGSPNRKPPPLSAALRA